jgi:hypothetical protein
MTSLKQIVATMGIDITAGIYIIVTVGIEVTVGNHCCKNGHLGHCWLTSMALDLTATVTLQIFISLQFL